LGSPILDVAAGTGRVAFTLARDGQEVVAIESSPSMLAEAQRKLELEPPEIRERITMIQGDMTNFQLEKKFSMIIIPNSFGHALTTDTQLSTLRCIHKHLAETGLFLLDLYPGALQNEHATFVDSPVPLSNGRTVERHGEIYTDFTQQLMQVDLRYIIRGSNKEIIDEVKVVSSAAILFNREVDLLLKMTGFEVVEELGSFEGQTYSPESGRRIMILRKRVHE